MAMTLDQLKDLMRAEGINFWLHPSEPRLQLGVWGIFGSFQVVISLEDEGKYLQVRAINYLACPATHPHLPAVLKAIAMINYQYRTVKYTWDPRDGEVAVFGDIWLLDGSVTQTQLGRVVAIFRSSLDWQYPRLRRIIETGEDPGDSYADELYQKLRALEQPTTPPTGPAAAPSPTAPKAGVDEI